MRYAHEPSPGIAAARNRALDSAGNAALLLFVDDDGLPAPGWLSAMVTPGVAGDRPPSPDPPSPVSSRASPTPGWWGRACSSGPAGRAATPGGASTANLLLDLRWLRAHDLRFDEAFGLTGGSDTMLTHAIVAAGGEIRWCDEAPVLDFQSVDRMTHGWVRRRSYRTGNDWSRVALALAPAGPRRWVERLELVARGSLRGATGLTNLARGTLHRDVGRRALGESQVCTALGVVGGAVGIVSAEYGRPAPA